MELELYLQSMKNFNLQESNSGERGYIDKRREVEQEKDIERGERRHQGEGIYRRR